MEKKKAAKTYKNRNTRSKENKEIPNKEKVSKKHSDTKIKKKSEKKKSLKSIKSKNKSKDVFFLFIFLAGLLLLIYPLFADYMLNKAQQTDIETYQKIKSIPSDREREIKQWNNMLRDPQTIEKQSDFNNSTHILPKTFAVIDIPKIKLQAPIYYSTSDLVLSKGVGILEGTNLPMGGEGTHSVLSAHRGLSLGKMFTELPNLKVGDLFYIDVFGDTLAYEVDQIKTINPEDISNFGIEDDKDYVTLLTCTPIGLNTQRIIVRGHRVPYNKGEKDSIKPYFWTMTNILILIVSLTFLIIFILILKKRVGK